MKDRQKVRVGQVLSDKMDKTVVVQVESHRSHPLYRKTMVVRRRYKAHDEQNQARVGDLVRIVEARPMSKEKRWRLVEILRRREVAEVQPSEIEV